MSKSFRYFYWLTAILLFTYVALCAIYVPFTVDEAWTYGEFIKGNFWDVVAYYHPVANNHLLNSLLSKPFSAISDSELSLRMPNVLAYLLYLFASFKLAQLVTKNKYLQACLFLVMNLNNSLLHFFALCRGYGISIGLLTYSICQLLNYIRRQNLNTIHICLLSVVLATYASFVVLFAAMAVFMLITVATLRDYRLKHNKVFLRNAVIILLLYGILAVELCLRPIILSIKWEQYYWGGLHNFFDDTLLSIVQDIVGYDMVGAYRILWLIPIVTAIAAPIVICIFLLLKRNLFKRCHAVVILILVWCIVAINTQFYVLGSPLVIHRTALYLYPLIVLSVFSSLSVLHDRYKTSAITTGALISTTLLIFLLLQINLNPVEEWWFDKDNKKVLKNIVAIPNKSNRKIKLLSFNFSSNSFNYYINRKYKDKLENVPNIALPDSEQQKNYDYLYLKTKDNASIPLSTFNIVHYYCDGRFILYKHKNF